MLQQLFLARNKGGAGVHKHAERRDSQWVGFVFKAWPLLLKAAPYLAKHTLAGSKLPFFEEFRAAYARIRADRDACALRETRYAAQVYHRLDGVKLTRFNPKSLPPPERFPDLLALDNMLHQDASTYTAPATRALAEVQRHVAYHAHVGKLAAIDALNDSRLDQLHGKNSLHRRNREQTRFVSCSLPLADKWKECTEATPDELFLIAYQFNTGLYISHMVDANRTLQAHGEEPDWLGDESDGCSAARGERNLRHDGGNRAWVKAARDALAVPVVECVRPTTKDPELYAEACAKYADFCKDKVPDWGAKRAAPDGYHYVGEHKCYNPIVKSTPGRGSRGGIGKVGHLYALGNTEEELILDNFGTAGRGLECDGTFDHSSGVGHVKARKGVYADALAKQNTLLLLISLRWH